MNTVFYQTRAEEPAWIRPSQVVPPIEGFPKVCISTFSQPIIQRFASMAQTKTIAHLYNANGSIPVYQITYEGVKMAFYLSPVGAPACVCALEEIIAMGAEKFIFFGSCGILDDTRTHGRLIIPTAAVRDEGTSYHYLPPSQEILPDPQSTAVLEQCFKRCGCSYVLGKVWTTDAIYRETVEGIQAHRNEGCLGVEMECAALLAAAKYRGVKFAQFFYGADCLDGDEWEPRDLADLGLTHAEKYFSLALECGRTL
ncbi:MAG: nucleoside phosphorylase [Blautia sp.]|jgi:uridine phosphorylase